MAIRSLANNHGVNDATIQKRSYCPSKPENMAILVMYHRIDDHIAHVPSNRWDQTFLYFLRRWDRWFIYSGDDYIIGQQPYYKGIDGWPYWLYTIEYMSSFIQPFQRQWGHLSGNDIVGHLRKSRCHCWSSIIEQMKPSITLLQRRWSRLFIYSSGD